MKKGFTLAEVLITLGIIGVVAALTLPSLTAKYRKHVVETKLQKFYSSINQAITLSEVDNGDKKTWEESACDQANTSATLNQVEWFNKYLKKYIKTIKVESDGARAAIIYLPDGSLFAMCAENIEFYTEAKVHEMYIDEDGNNQRSKEYSGTKLFNFVFGSNSSCPYNVNKGVEPYLCEWDGTENGLRNSPNLGCAENMPINMRAYCTAVIQMNGWKIPNDYPLKF